jgi:hypothetical protein
MDERETEQAVTEGRMTPGQRRTLRARKARTKNKHERYAAELRDAGFLVVPPEAVPAVRSGDVAAALAGGR